MRLPHRPGSRLPTAAALAGALALAACADAPTSSPAPAGNLSFSKGDDAASHAVAQHLVGDPAPFFVSEMAAANERLAAAGANVRVEVAELLLAPDAPADMGTTIYANNRTHHLPYFWVPGDERRLADGNNLTYLVDESHAYAYTRTSFPGRAYFGDRFDASFAPWAGLACGKAQLIKRPDTGVDPSIVDDGAGKWWLADIVEAGWRALPAGVLGVAYTFVFLNDDGTRSDVDRDGRADTALSEIWYSDRYYWTTNEVPGIDFLSVAIHENGHSLGIGHFGKLFVTNANGKLHFAPRAIMNAAYVSRMQELQGTDEASYCGNFASWPS